MKTPRYLLLLLLLLTLVLFQPFQHIKAQEFGPTPTLGAPPSPADIINAINNLRLSYGLAPLMMHPVLMQIAQEQANGIAAGLPGHWRPNGLTLGQWMISLGYPLSGDLSLDGYRSENWGPAMTAEDAVNMWLGDDIHTNTMLSTERSDIGAGVAVGDGTFIVVIETALQTRSGQMQSSAYDFLTKVPATQTALALNGSISQYSIPVAVNTAQPNGDVYHQVQYGQTLWSIAVTYGTTIKSIQALNNLGASIDVYEGQRLLVSRGATQPAPVIETFAATEGPASVFQVTPSASITPTLALSSEVQPEAGEDNALSIGAIAVSALFLAGLFTVMTRKAVP